MLSRHERVGSRGVAAVAVLAIGLISCTSAGGVSGALATESTQIQSNTPRITVGEDQTERSAMLLTADDMRGIEGLEDVTAVEMTDYPVYENPDPRGPCGGIAPPLPLDDPVGRGFSSSSLPISVFELITRRGADQDAYLDAMQADRRDECGPFESTTNVGQTQSVSEISFVDVQDLGVPAISVTERIEIAGQFAHVGVVLLLVDDGMIVIQMQSTAPIDAVMVAEIAERSLRRANG
jgi:hypothetical protein